MSRTEKKTLLRFSGRAAGTARIEPLLERRAGEGRVRGGQQGTRLIEVAILVAVSALVVLLFQHRTLHRGAGIGLLTLYVEYVAYVLVRGV